ncbi:hypothetical protein S40288_09086 [Stachybotrys chartarum IBT 40288]|nr:hypothetical protein S40288_09086 [Stachybotrys chartarum IBT 40288]
MHSEDQGDGRRVCKYCHAGIKVFLNATRSRTPRLFRQKHVQKSYYFESNPVADVDCFVCIRLLRRGVLEPRGTTELMIKALPTAKPPWDIFIERAHGNASRAASLSMLADGDSSPPPLGLTLFSHKSLPPKFTDLGHDIPSSIWSPQNISMAKKCLDKCMTRHSDCLRPKIATDRLEIPLRLLFLEERGGSINARLVEKTAFPEDVRYLTLSHCWGTRRFLTLTERNYALLHEKIPLENHDFNPVFRDAIRVALDLGYSYLWIDALCIIQDAQDAWDWVQQCPRIGNYYINSDITISATGYSDGQAGLFASIEPATSGPIHLDFGAHGSYSMMVGDYPKSLIQDSPLLRRGWAVQEQMLSPRTLHFTRESLIWVCCEDASADVWLMSRFNDLQKGKGVFYQLQGAPVNRPSKAVEDILKTSFRVKDRIMRQDRDEEVSALMHDWYSAVLEQYYGSVLTYAGDRLPAISGLAAVFQRQVDSRYLAGHWEKGLLESLTWNVEVAHEQLPRSREPYVAPSWSWASLFAPVKVNVIPAPTGWKRDYIPIAKVLDADVTLASADLWGAVSDGVLRIDGALQKLEFIERQRTSLKPQYLGWAKLSYVKVTLDLYADIQSPSIQQYFQEEPNDAPAAEHFLLPLFIVSYTTSVVGLLLEKSSSHESAYERVAYVEMGVATYMDPGAEDLSGSKLSSEKLRKLFAKETTVEVEIV